MQKLLKRPQLNLKKKKKTLIFALQQNLQCGILISDMWNFRICWFVFSLFSNGDDEQELPCFN
jgi:hypothetical protein